MSISKEEFIGIAADADMRHAGLKPEHEDLGIGADPITAGMIRAETVERVTAVLSRVGAWETREAAKAWLNAPLVFPEDTEEELARTVDALAIAEKRS